MSHRMDVSKFLDIEAQVQDDDSEESSDNESSCDFIEDHIVEDSVARIRWDNLEQWEEEESPEFLQNLALSFKSGDGPSPHEFDEELHSYGALAPELLSGANGEVSLWRVRVKFGSERDVVLAIMQKVIASGSQHSDILASFSRDAIHGWIFIESKSQSAIPSILQGINGVINYRHAKFRIEAIDYRDYLALLDMNLHGIPPHVAPFSWVRIKSGKYRQDLGVVTNVNDFSLECQVALVPRLHYSNKRKRRSRAPALLFDADKAQLAYAGSAVETRNGFKIFKGEAYHEGLHITKFHLTRLRTQGINATEQELDSFRCVPEIWDNAKFSISPLRTRDRIRIYHGPLAGLTGVILDIKEFTVSFRADQIDPVQEVLISEVRKLFTLGDCVEVVSGVDRGKEGYIVSLGDNSACIYSRRIGHLSSSFVELPGKEIVVNLEDLDWKSTPEGPSHTSPSNHPTTPDPPNGPVVVGAKSHAKNQERPNMYTGDRYRHMEVSIHKGDAKSHFGVIRGSHYNSTGEVVFDVQTSTRVINTTKTYPGDHLRERHTGLRLDRACWIPLNFLRPINKPPPLLPSSSTPSRLNMTPLHSDPTESIFEVNTQSAFKPDHEGPQEDVAPTTAPLAGTIATAPLPGSWLLDPRLTHKKLDVRISGTTGTTTGTTGTTEPPWQGGRHEGHVGFLVLTKPPIDVETSHVVKVGFEQSRMYFKMRHLLPETTTERPGFVYASVSKPIISSIGERVVIIGPDLTGDSNFIGYYGLVVVCPFTLGVGEACIQMASHGALWGRHAYFHESSLCRSHLEPSGPVNWLGTYY